VLALASRDPHVTHRPPNSYSSLSSFLVIYTATLTHQQVMSPRTLAFCATAALMQLLHAI